VAGVVKRVALLASFLVASGAAAVTGCSSDGASGATQSPIADAAPADAAPPIDAGTDALDFGAPSTTYPAYTPPPFPIVQHGTGWLTTDFTVVPVVFAGDTGVANVTDFLTRWAASAEFAAVSEYGVGKMTVGATITLADAAPATLTDQQLQAWLFDRLDGTHPEWGPTDAATLKSTIYLLLYPDGTTLSVDRGGTSCGDFAGYHGAAAAPPPDAGALDAGAQPPILYAAIPRCAVTGYSVADSQTEIIAHELIETATNPFHGGYMFVDNDHIPWAIGMHGGELADLCNIVGTYWKPPSVGYTISRFWSKAAASAFRNPCVPGPPDEAYFTSFIAPVDKFAIADTPGAPTIGGVRARIGDTRSVDVLLVSDRATGPWEIHAREVPMISNNPLALTLALDRTSGSNGEKVHLSITANKSVPNGVTIVMLASKLGTPPRETLWFTPVSLR
jgi:hypothetical protein